MALLSPKTPAPAFELANQDGTPVNLSDFKNKYVVIYFYPKALTPGCTTQACDLRDGLAELNALDAVVLGISPDKPTLLKKFQETEKLNFTLLSDTTHEIAEKYGVWQEKSMYGKKYMGIARTTYLIAPGGSIFQVLPNVNPKTHFTEVKKALEQRISAKS